MSYGYADTGNKVGFRPYYRTNPQGAAQLSGLGQNHPFKPQAWHLHGDGLGDYEMLRPFDPWELYSDQRHAAGLSGIGDLGDATSDAVTELENAGQITSGEAEAILDGSMSFQDVLGYDPTDQGTWLSFTSTLQSWNSDLKNFEAAVQSNPAVAAAIGRDVVAQRTTYGNIVSQFVYYYNLFGGSTPPGLSGLGSPVLLWWIAGSAVFIIGAIIAYQAFQVWKVQAQAKLTAAQSQQTTATSTSSTNASLLAALAAAQAKGDTVTANAILQTLQKTAATPPQPGTTEQWLMTNAKWLAIGAAALIAVGPVTSGLFGGGRRR